LRGADCCLAVAVGCEFHDIGGAVYPDVGSIFVLLVSQTYYASIHYSSIDPPFAGRCTHACCSTKGAKLPLLYLLLAKRSLRSQELPDLVQALSCKISVNRTIGVGTRKVSYLVPFAFARCVPVTPTAGAGWCGAMLFQTEGLGPGCQQPGCLSYSSICWLVAVAQHYWSAGEGGSVRVKL
jgi:hypothetical protein